MLGPQRYLAQEPVGCCMERLAPVPRGLQCALLCREAAREGARPPRGAGRETEAREPVSRPRLASEAHVQSRTGVRPEAWRDVGSHTGPLLGATWPPGCLWGARALRPPGGWKRGPPEFFLSPLPQSPLRNGAEWGTDIPGPRAQRERSGAVGGSGRAAPRVFGDSEKRRVTAVQRSGGRTGLGLGAGRHVIPAPLQRAGCGWW